MFSGRIIKLDEEPRSGFLPDEIRSVDAHMLRIVNAAMESMMKFTNVGDFIYRSLSCKDNFKIPACNDI